MSASTKSSAKSLQPRQRNHFYTWYRELCRISNTNPFLISNPGKSRNEVVLDFVADRIKPEEWIPIFNALCLDKSLCFISIKSCITGSAFYREVDTEDKLRKIKKQIAAIHTDYILQSLIKSLGCCVKNSLVLTGLELENIMLAVDYLELLLQNLRYNRTIKLLSLKQCPLKDEGCQLICTNLRLLPNIEMLNLSSTGLAVLSGINIGKIIKHQQFSRYSGNWNVEDTQTTFRGLKRITIDNNPDIGDDGLAYILDALDDDLWVKAIDMRNCGITEMMSNRLLNLIEQSLSLEVADFRNNDKLSLLTLDRIYEILEGKYEFGEKPEFEWDVITISIESTPEP